MKLRSRTLPISDEIVLQAAGNVGKLSVLVNTGHLAAKHMRVRKDRNGWFVMRGSRGHDKVYLVSAETIQIDDYPPSITFQV